MILGCVRTDSMIRLTAPTTALACETPKRVRKKGFHQANWMGIALITHGFSSSALWYIYSHTCHGDVAQVWAGMTWCVKSLRESVTWGCVFKAFEPSHPEARFVPHLPLWI